VTSADDGASDSWEGQSESYFAFAALRMYTFSAASHSSLICCFCSLNRSSVLFQASLTLLATQTFHPSSGSFAIETETSRCSLLTCLSVSQDKILKPAACCRIPQEDDNRIRSLHNTINSITTVDAILPETCAKRTGRKLLRIHQPTPQHVHITLRRWLFFHR
jgi:hypothetical protein